MKFSLTSLLLTLISLNNWAQSFTVQSNSVTLNGSPNVQDFNDNTYLDAFSTETLTWSIVADSMPSSWDYSNCFPNCYPIGTTNGTLSITNGQSYYLNGHIYPNNTPGEGYWTMEITNGTTTELVTWHVVAGSVGILNDWINNNQTKIRTICNLEGKMVNELKPNQIFIVVYNDNTSKKVFVSER